jgi:hypothetical protein
MILAVLIAAAFVLAGLGVPPWLVAAVDVLIYLGDLYVHPFKPCPRCSGRGIPGTNRGSRRSAFGRCKRCGGTRQVQRIGSKQLHRAARALVTARNNRKDN